MAHRPEPIGAPTASDPAATLTLAAHMLSAGDLEAAVALYAPGGVVAWGPGRDGRGAVGLRAVLAALMALRLPIRASVDAVMQADDLALVTGTRHLSGLSPDGEPTTLSGRAVIVARRAGDGRWLAALDRWDLDPAPPT